MKQEHAFFNKAVLRNMSRQGRALEIMVHKDFANLDALAAVAQRNLHRFAAADDADAAQAARKVNTDILVAFWR